MTIMKYYTIALISLFCLNCSAGFAQDNNKESIMEQFLGLDCTQDSKAEDELSQGLLKNSEEAEKFFILLIEEGPDKAWLEKEQADAIQLYEVRSSFNANKERKITYEGEAFEKGGPEELGQKEYVTKRLSSFIIRLKLRALQGLKILNTPSSMEYLKEKAYDEKFRLHPLAAELLEMKE